MSYTILAVLALVACGEETTGPETPEVATISFTAPAASIVPNEEVTIAAVAKSAAGATIANAALNWSTSNAAAVTVSGAGAIKGVAPGSATITATSGAATATLNVTVDQGGFIGATGGTISAFNGGITLNVPAGALATGTAIRLRGITAPPADPTFVTGSGGAVDFAGSFATPARLTLSYNAANGPAGLAESRLGLRVLNNGQWTPISGSTVDPAADRASAEIMAPGSYGVGMRPSETPCTAAEHRLFDFRVGSFSWNGPGGLVGDAEITAEPSGCALRETLRITNGNQVRAVMFYEPANQQWHYTSVDGNAVSRLSGGLEGGRMILYNAARRQRVVWEQTSTTAHVQAGEASQNGTDWTRQAAGTYVRKAVAGNVLTPAGGRVLLADGDVVLEAPAGAVSQNVTLDVSVAALAGPLDASLVRGAVYTITADPAVTFAQPVRVTVRYNPRSGPGGVAESDFRMAVVSGTEWQTVAGAQVDTAANTVTAPVTNLGTFTAHRPVPTAACTDARHRQFDFWVGEWNVGPTRSSITRDASGCTIFEFWQGQQPGRSISLYDARSGKWHQTYVTGNTVSYLSGGIENGKMVMYGYNPDGTINVRWTWERISDTTVTQRAENTRDNGATYTPGFLGTYVRR